MNRDHQLHVGLSFCVPFGVRFTPFIHTWTWSFAFFLRYIGGFHRYPNRNRYWVCIILIPRQTIPNVELNRFDWRRPAVVNTCENHSFLVKELLDTILRNDKRLWPQFNVHGLLSLFWANESAFLLFVQVYSFTHRVRIIIAAYSKCSKDEQGGIQIFDSYRYLWFAFLQFTFHAKPGLHSLSKSARNIHCMFLLCWCPGHPTPWSLMGEPPHFSPNKSSVAHMSAVQKHMKVFKGFTWSQKEAKDSQTGISWKLFWAQHSCGCDQAGYLVPCVRS